MKDINAAALQSIARMAYGSGVFERTHGGKGNIGALTDGDGNLRVIKFNTHAGERVGPATADQIAASNNLRTQLLALADNYQISAENLTKLKKLLAVGENNEIREGAPLMTRKIAAKAVKLIDADVFKAALKGVDPKQLASGKRVTTITEAVKGDYQGAVEADDVKLIADKVSCFQAKCDELKQKRNVFIAESMPAHDFYYGGKGKAFNQVLDNIRSVVTEDIKGRKFGLGGFDGTAIEKLLDDAVACTLLAFGRKDLALAYLSTSTGTAVTEQSFNANPVLAKFSAIIQDATATAERFGVSEKETEKLLTDVVVEMVRQAPFADVKIADAKIEKFVNNSFCKIADARGDREMRDIVGCRQDADKLFQFVNNDVVIGKNGLNLDAFKSLVQANLHADGLAESTNAELKESSTQRRHHMEGVGRLLVKNLQTAAGGPEKLESMKKALLENEENRYPFGLLSADDDDAASIFNGMLDGLGFHRSEQVTTAHRILDVVVSRVKESFVEMESITEPPNEKAEAQKSIRNLKAYYGETDESIRENAIKMLNDIKNPVTGESNYLRTLSKLDFTDIKQTATELQKSLNDGCKKIQKNGNGNLGLFNGKFLQVFLRELNTVALFGHGTGVNVCGKTIKADTMREDPGTDHTLNSQYSNNASVNEQIKAIFEALNDKIPAKLLPAVCLVCSSNGTVALPAGQVYRNDSLVGGDDGLMPNAMLQMCGLVTGSAATIYGIDIKQGEDGLHVTTTLSNSYKLQSSFGKVDVPGKKAQVGLFDSSSKDRPQEAMLASGFINVEVVIPNDWSLDDQKAIKVVSITGKQISGEEIKWKE